MPAEDHSNGNILARFGKYSWVVTILALFMGPVGSFLLFRQEMLVEVAQIQLQISQHAEELKALQEKVDKGMVPREVHDTRIEMQKEVDFLRDQLNKERAENNKRAIDELREQLRRRP